MSKQATPPPNSPPTPSAPSSPLNAAQSLNDYFVDEADRRGHTREMFDTGAPGYDKAEWITGLGTGPWYRRQVLERLGLKPGQSVLDVAIGTGLVAREIQKLIQPGGEVVGLDPSPGMLAEAKRKLDIETIEGYAESIPLENDRFDVVTMGYALRHVSSLEQAFNEYLRVLKPGGAVCLMEISRPTGRVSRVLAKAYIRRAVPAIARLMGEKKEVARLWRYYWETIDHCVDPDAIMSALRAAGFIDVRCDSSMGIFREYLGKKPAADIDN